MGSNADLHKANKAKKDEFYTQLPDIENELKHYKEHFKGKTVFCNCDDPYESNFFKYFAMNFNHLGLKKLICTSYSGSPIVGQEFSDLPLFKSLNSKKAYKVEITEVYDENKDGAVDMYDIELLIKNMKNKMTLLKGDGDFRSKEAIECLREADIVVTNPPFSLFREYLAQLVKYKKDFIIIGNVNAVTYKEVFPLIKDNKVWFGQSIHSGDREFRVPNSYPLNASGSRVDSNGIKYIRVKGVRWYTNVDFKERHDDLILYKHYSPEEYPKYDNYDAINIDKTNEIPCDYDGVMGVPITFLDKYNPDQFEIVAFRKGEDGRDLVFTRERERGFNHTFVSLYDVDSRNDKKCRRENQWKNYIRQNNHHEKEPIDFFFPYSTNLKNGLVNDCRINGKKTYVRILIKRKESNEN